MRKRPRRRTLTTEAAEALLAGGGADQHRDVADALERLRRAYEADPSAGATTRHVSEMRAAAADARRARPAPRLLPLGGSGGGFRDRLSGTRRVAVGAAAAVVAAAVAFGLTSGGNGSSGGDGKRTTVELISAARHTQPEFDVACAEQAAELQATIDEYLARLRTENPELAAQIEAWTQQWGGSVDSTGLCEFDWASWVGASCDETEEGHTIPDDITAELPPEILAIIDDPCNVDWESIDWEGLFSSVDFANLLDLFCTGTEAASAEGEGDGWMEEFLGFCNGAFDPARWGDFDPSQFTDRYPPPWPGPAPDWGDFPPEWQEPPPEWPQPPEWGSGSWPG